MTQGRLAVGMDLRQQAIGPCGAMTSGRSPSLRKRKITQDQVHSHIVVAPDSLFWNEYFPFPCFL